MEHKCKIFKKGNKQSGITLVALVVTIVVLLILAGISIRLVLDNNGIINKAGEGKEKYGQAKENEQTDLDNALDWIDEMTGANIVEPENVDDWAYRVEDDGTLTITGYKGTATEVVIPNSIDGVRVKSIYNNYGPIWDSSICNGDEHIVGSSGYVSQNTITSIIISYGIEKIGNEAFWFTTELNNISIPNSVTSMEDAFYGCTSLTSITIPDSVTSMEDAFEGCTSLTNVTIPDSVTSIAWAFSGCTSLTSINIPNSVTNIKRGFF